MKLSYIRQRRNHKMRKKQMLANFLNVEYLPDLTMESYDLANKPSFPIEKLGSFGASIKPLVDLINLAKTASGGSGIYRVDTKGMKMFTANADGHFIGALKDASSGAIGGQARMTPIAIDPLSITIAVVVMGLEHKINVISEDQKALIAFLELKEEVKIKSNINLLLEILNNYKYNFNNSQYKNSNHGLVKTIKKESDESILLFDQLLNEKVSAKSVFHFDKKVEEEISDVVSKLNNYQLGLYGFAFSSLLDIILLDNFNSDFIKSILKKINEYQDKYIATFKAIEQKIFQASSSSFESTMAKGLSNLNASLGKLASRTHLLGKTELEKSFIQNSEKLSKLNDEKIASKVGVLSSTRKNLIQPFIEKIKFLDLIYNGSYKLVFNQKNLYIDL